MMSDRTLSWAFFLCVSIFASVFVFGLTGCGPSDGKPNVELIQDMMVQPANKAQDFLASNPEKSSQLVPPEGTAAVNREVYLFKGNPEGAANSLKMPEVTADMVKLGEKHFKNYCVVCHGEKGAGDGPVASKFQGVKPPSLLSEKVRGMKDGGIYHIITDGQGVMGMYTTQMPWSKDRWAVVAYVRKLQSDNK
jgi:mono/diheme cytochrome c family protein